MIVVKLAFFWLRIMEYRQTLDLFIEVSPTPVSLLNMNALLIITKLLPIKNMRINKSINNPCQITNRFLRKKMGNREKIGSKMGIKNVPFIAGLETVSLP